MVRKNVFLTVKRVINKPVCYYPQALNFSGFECTCIELFLIFNKNIREICVISHCKMPVFENISDILVVLKIRLYFFLIQPVIWAFGVAIGECTCISWCQTRQCHIVKAVMVLRQFVCIPKIPRTALDSCCAVWFTSANNKTVIYFAK